MDGENRSRHQVFQAGEASGPHWAGAFFRLMSSSERQMEGRRVKRERVEL